MFEVKNIYTIKNMGDYHDALNDLQSYIDSDKSKLTDSQYNELATIADEFARWKPVIEQESHCNGKEAEL